MIKKKVTAAELVKRANELFKEAGNLVRVDVSNRIDFVELFTMTDTHVMCRANHFEFSASFCHFDKKQMTNEVLACS